MQQACVYSYRLLNAIGTSWGILHWLGKGGSRKESSGTLLKWSDRGRSLCQVEGNFHPISETRYLGLSRVFRSAKEWSWVHSQGHPVGQFISKVKVIQSCLTLCDPMNCSLPGFSVHGDSPGKNTGVGCHALLQGVFLTQGSNLGLLHCRWILYALSHLRSPIHEETKQNRKERK